jgi:hypothetical protein
MANQLLTGPKRRVELLPDGEPSPRFLFSFRLALASNLGIMSHSRMILAAGGSAHELELEPD